MKKKYVLPALGLWLACLGMTTFARAGSSTPQLEMAVEPGLMFGIRPQYGAGVAGGLFVGLPVDSELSVGILPGFYTIPCSPIGSSSDVISNVKGGASYLELAAAFKIRSGDGPVRFLVTGGGGLALFSDNSSYDDLVLGSMEHFSTNISGTIVPAARFALGMSFKIGAGSYFDLPIGADVVWPSYGDLASFTLQPALDFSF